MLAQRHGTIIQTCFKHRAGYLCMCATTILHLGMLKHKVETDACIQQRTIIRTCLNTSCRLMLVSHPVITIQRAGDRRMSAASKWMRGLNITTLRSMPPVPLFELHIFHPDTSTRSKIVNSRTDLHYPSQKQWLPSVRGIRKPPRRARHGAPTWSHRHGWAAPTTCWLKSPLSVRAVVAEREGETLGKLWIRSPQIYPAVPGKARHSSPYGQTIEKPANAALDPRSANQDVPLDDRWQSIDKDWQCCRIVNKWSHREHRNRVVLEQDQRTNRFYL